MNKKTLRALKGSIKKWEKIVAEKGIDDGSDNCPLCELFLKDNYDYENCDNCPVCVKTKDGYCRNTPYADWLEHQIWVHGRGDAYYIKCDECKSLAKKELKFLESLLPKEVKK